MTWYVALMFAYVTFLKVDIITSMSMNEPPATLNFMLTFW